jgi:hypothetical protein
VRRRDAISKNTKQVFHFTELQGEKIKDAGQRGGIEKSA